MKGDGIFPTRNNGFVLKPWKSKHKNKNDMSKKTNNKRYINNGFQENKFIAADLYLSLQSVKNTNNWASSHSSKFHRKLIFSAGNWLCGGKAYIFLIEATLYNKSCWIHFRIQLVSHFLKYNIHSFIHNHSFAISTAHLILNALKGLFSKRFLF